MFWFPASTDRTARLWSLHTGLCTSVLRGHNGIVPCLAVATCAVACKGWTPDGDQPSRQPQGLLAGSAIAATACGDGTCRLWNVLSSNEAESSSRDSDLGRTAAAVSFFQELKGWSEGGINLVSFVACQTHDNNEFGQKKLLVSACG